MSLRRRRESGQSLAEFALVFPIFLLIVVGLFDVGRAVFAYTSITNASREAARLAIVNQDLTLIDQRGMQQTAATAAVATELDVTFEDPATGSSCSPIRIGCIAVVNYTTNYRPITPIVGRILFPSGVDLTAITELPVEYLCPNATYATGALCPKQP